MDLNYLAKVAYQHHFGVSLGGDNLLPNQELVKASHSILANDVKIDPIPFAPTAKAAQNNANAENSVVKYWDKVILTEVPGTNKQAFYFTGSIDGHGEGYIDKWIQPLDSQQGFKQSPGYAAVLFDQNNKVIDPNAGYWYINYNNGLVMFESGNKPGKGLSSKITTLKLSFYQYVGKTLANMDFAPTWGEF